MPERTARHERKSWTGTSGTSRVSTSPDCQRSGGYHHTHARSATERTSPFLSVSSKLSRGLGGSGAFLSLGSGRWSTALSASGSVETFGRTPSAGADAPAVGAGAIAAWRVPRASVVLRANDAPVAPA